MQTTTQYIDAIKKRLSLTLDTEVAGALGVSRACISLYRKKKSFLDNNVALKVAEILNLPPLQVIASANAERAHDAEEKKKWLHLAKTAIFASAMVGAGIFGAPSPAGAAEIQANVYYVKRRRVLFPWARWGGKDRRKPHFHTTHQKQTSFPQLSNSGTHLA